jgi:hypothetical protein
VEVGLIKVQELVDSFHGLAELGVEVGISKVQELVDSLHGLAE